MAEQAETVWRASFLLDVTDFPELLSDGPEACVRLIILDAAIAHHKRALHQARKDVDMPQEDKARLMAASLQRMMVVMMAGANLTVERVEGAVEVRVPTFLDDGPAAGKRHV